MRNNFVLSPLFSLGDFLFEFMIFVLVTERVVQSRSGKNRKRGREEKAVNRNEGRQKGRKMD